MKFTDYINEKIAQYKQNGMMMHLMCHQALQRAGHEHRILTVTPEQITIMDAELDRRLGGKRINGKRVN